MNKPNFEKSQGIIPVIIQHARTWKILMLGYMNQEAYQQTQTERKVTFFSRSKNRLWTKGESSGHFLWVEDWAWDCDQDTLLIWASPEGPTCHTGQNSCFGINSAKGFLYELEQQIHQRIENKVEHSYTYQLYQKGINKIAQKVGEEAVELVIEAKDENIELLKNEAADLLYHFLILLRAKGVDLEQIEQILQQRKK